MQRARTRIDLAALPIHREAFRLGEIWSPRARFPDAQMSFLIHPHRKDVMETIVDVRVSGSQPSMFLLPGVLLAHGHSSANDKAAALLWQLWLECGPLLQDLISCYTSVWSPCLQTCGTSSASGHGIGLGCARQTHI